MKFPQYAVNKWIGHSITVSGRHYANDVPDELFAKANGMSDEGNSSAQRHAQRPMQMSTSSTPNLTGSTPRGQPFPSTFDVASWPWLKLPSQIRAKT